MYTEGVCYSYTHHPVRVLFMKISTLLGRRYHVEYGWMIWFFCVCCVFVVDEREVILHFICKVFEGPILICYSALLLWCFFFLPLVCFGQTVNEQMGEKNFIISMGLIWMDSCFIHVKYAIKFFVKFIRKAYRDSTFFWNEIKMFQRFVKK